MKWIKRHYARYTAQGKFWLTVGIVCLIVDMAIGYMAGMAQATFWHGVGAAMLAAGFAFLPDAAYEEYEQRRTASAIIMALICIPIGVKAYEQQLTYSAGMRHGEIKATVIQNTKYDGAQASVKDESINLGFWRDQKVTLEKERATMVGAMPWATTLTADALRKEVADLDVKIAEEAKGGRGGRRAGCKAECEKLKDQRTAVEKQIAGIERLDVVTAKIAELDQRIASAQKVLDKKRDVASTTEHKFSLNEEVARKTAQLVALFTGSSPAEAINPDQVAMQYATLGSAGLGSLALLIMAPVGFFLAGRRKLPATPDEVLPGASAPNSGGAHQPAPFHTAPKGIPSEPITIHTREQIADPIIRRWSTSDEVAALLGVNQPKAA